MPHWPLGIEGSPREPFFYLEEIVMKKPVIVFAMVAGLMLAPSALADFGAQTIYDIQYSTDSAGGYPSPFAGDDDPLTLDDHLQTTGIVTAVTYWGDFYIQDGAGSWNGLFVYGPDYDVAVGDLVEVDGEIREHYTLTEMKHSSLVSIISSSNPLPAMTVLATGDVADEQWEGTLVRVEDVLCSDPADGYGEWDVDDGSGSVAVGDSMDTYGFEPLLGEYFSYVQGPLDFSYSEFKIQPRDMTDLPEPATLSLLVFGGLMMVRRRR